MSMLADVILKRITYPSLFYAGTFPMFLSVFAVTLLAHYENWDPAMVLLKKIHSSIAHKLAVHNRSLRYYSTIIHYVMSNEKHKITQLIIQGKRDRVRNRDRHHSGALDMLCINMIYS